MCSSDLTATASVSISVVDYTEPTIESVLSQRCLSSGTIDDDGTYVSAKCSYSYSTCSGNNTLTRNVYYRKVGTSTWSSGVSFNSGTAVTIGEGNIDVDNSYEIKYELTDAFGTVYQIDGVSTSFSIVDFKKGGRGIAIGKASTQNNVCEVALPLNPSGGFKFPALSEGDFDDLKDVNIYCISSTAAGLPTWENAPPTTARYGLLEVLPTTQGTSRRLQKFTGLTNRTPITYYRYWVSSAWSYWLKQAPPQRTLIENANWSSGDLSVTDISLYSMVLVKLVGESTMLPCTIDSGYCRGGVAWVNTSGHIITYSFSATISGDVLTYVNSGYMRHNASGDHSAWTQVAVEKIIGLI